MQDPRSADTARSFSRQAAAYAESRSHAYGEDLDIVAAYAEPGQYFLCLDIACGPGHTAFRITSKAFGPGRRMPVAQRYRYGG